MKLLDARSLAMIIWLLQISVCCSIRRAHSTRTLFWTLLWRGLIIWTHAHRFVFRVRMLKHHWYSIIGTLSKFTVRLVACSIVPHSWRSYNVLTCCLSCCTAFFESLIHYYRNVRYKDGRGIFCYIRRLLWKFLKQFFINRADGLTFSLWAKVFIRVKWGGYIRGPILFEVANIDWPSLSFDERMISLGLGVLKFAILFISLSCDRFL